MIADQGWEKAGSSKPAVRLTDASYTFRGRLVVEQHASAAIDLGVNESRQKDAAVKIVVVLRCWSLRNWSGIGNAARPDTYRQPLDETRSRHHPTVVKYEIHQRVSVTLAK